LAKNTPNTVAKVWQLAEETAARFNLKIWDVKFEKEGPDWFLRIFIDSENGVTIEDCENVSRAIDKPLDELNPIEQGYILEVCSPGLERKLTRDEHFAAYIGADVLVKLVRPFDVVGKEFGGVLSGFDGGIVTITDHSGQNQIELAKKDIVFVKLDDF
jgi:ribosome maturation factor RimP